MDAWETQGGHTRLGRESWGEIDEVAIVLEKRDLVVEGAGRSIAGDIDYVDVQPSGWPLGEGRCLRDYYRPAVSAD
jgi:hypothetical protein